MANVAATNEEAVEAWNGVLFDRFVQYRHARHRAASAPTARRRCGSTRPQPGERVLDIGCGFGDTDAADRRAGRARGLGARRRRGRAVHRARPRGGRGGRARERRASPSATCR